MNRLNAPELTVSELSGALKRTVEDAYGFVRVRGELGNVKQHSSGHVYLDLKDDKACIAGVIWRGTAGRIKVKLEAGLEVVVTGRLTTYAQQSKYQIVIEQLSPAGIGALMALLEQRKAAFAKEGLFDPARKQLLPYLPAVIGVVTSPTGAVIRDILHRLADRFARRVVVWPVRVQGEGSAEQVAAAIRGFNALVPGGGIPVPDVLIVARGGGSLEDLWSFNEEIVVRAAADSLIPLIAAVGHETDVTLIDFVADKRAPTPTAAAEMAVPVRAELIVAVDALGRRGRDATRRGLERLRSELRAAVRVLPSAEALLASVTQRLDGLGERAPRALRANARAHRAGFAHVAGRLHPQGLRIHIRRADERLRALTARAQLALRARHDMRRARFAAVTLRLGAALRANQDAHRLRLGTQRDRLAALAARAERGVALSIARRWDALDRHDLLLTALSYQGVLARGFALVRDAEGSTLRGVGAVTEGMRLDIEFSDGHVTAVASGAQPTPARRRPRRGPKREQAPDLFDAFAPRARPPRDPG